jgi:hypothetical protein
MMETFCIAETQIQVLPDPDSGQQTIRIQATPFGERLARMLETLPPVPGDDDFFLLAHTPELDSLLCTLVELFISLRYSHPQLLQLRLFPTTMLLGARSQEALT